MRGRTPRLVVLLLVPLAAALAAATARQGVAEITIVGTVISHSNVKHKQKGVPDRWHVDLNGDRADDLVIETSGRDAPGSDLVCIGVDVEAVIVLTDRRRKTYELLDWVRIGVLH